MQRQSPGLGTEAATRSPTFVASPFSLHVSLPSLFSHCEVWTKTNVQDTFHASVQTQYEMKNSYP